MAADQRNDVTINVDTARLRLRTYKAGIKQRHRDPNRAKFDIEETKGQVWSKSKGRWVTIHRIINRAENKYFELVVDEKTGEILRECEERLSDHRGRGSAKSSNHPKGTA